jgi:uncharacterized protein (DUF305 family)
MGETSMTKKTIALFVIAASTIGFTSGVRAQKPEAASASQHEQMIKGMMGMTDERFVPMMIKHHQHGIEMARLEEDRGSSASVKALAAKIRQSQEKELAELKTHAEHVAKGASGHAEHDKMMELQSQSMMAKLKSASGAALDHAFLEQMAKHHEGAIAMTEGAKLQDPELKKLAQQMLTGQRQELAELKKELAAHASPKQQGPRAPQV